MSSTVDRPLAIRRALRDLVAERGFHGASMSAVATAAGVATGTAYVHYESKEELVYATYIEIKAALGAAVFAGYDESAPPSQRWRHVLTAAYGHLSTEPERARFLSQLEESPYYEQAYARLVETGDPLTTIATAPDLADLLVPLPSEVIYALSLGVAVRLIAAGTQLNPDELDELVDATWRGVTRP